MGRTVQSHKACLLIKRRTFNVIGKYTYSNVKRGVIRSHQLIAWIVVFNATFSNISVISWWSVSLLEESRKSLTNLITHCCLKYTSPWTGFDLTTLVVVGTDYIGSCKSTYHTITATTAINCKTDDIIQ